MELYDTKEICCCPVYPKQDSVIYTPLLSYINARESEEFILLSPTPRPPSPPALAPTKRKDCLLLSS